MPMDKDLVIGLDVSTSATKAIAWTRDGVPLAEGRSAIAMSRPSADAYEQDPEEWWRSACAALRELLGQVDPARIAALAISNQRETFVPLAADGSAVRPAIVWLDQRARPYVGWLSSRVGACRIHEISGKPVDVAPVAYRLAWMLHQEPEAYARAAVFADVHAYLALRFTGSLRTSWASADPLGLFDMRTRAWSPEILSALQLEPARLPECAPPGAVIGHIHRAGSQVTGLAEGTHLVAGGGDGQAAGLGVNALGPGRAYLNLGTAVVAGIYSAKYRTGQAWRTMGSCSGEGYYYETSLRSGTLLVDWFVENCGSGESRQTLEAQAAGLPTGAEAILAVPYWGAVMTPYWDANARGCLIGLTTAHRASHLYRAILEGIALEQALVTSMIEEAAGIAVEEFVAIGGGAASDLWCTILANVCGKPVLRSQSVEASSLGAAMCAASGAGWYPTVSDAAAAMCGQITRRTDPSPERQAHYAELAAIYRDIYPQLREIYRRLSAVGQVG
jgi:sugar (pentulose or hexulose) kinase